MPHNSCLTFWGHFTFHAPPLTAPPVFAKGNQGGKATKWLPAHFNFARENAPKLKKVRPSTLRDWPPCLPVQRDGWRQSRPGANPFISALTVVRCPATFPGVWPQLRDILPTSRSVGRGTGLSYTCRRSLKPARFFVHSHSQKFSLFSCRSKRGAKSTAPPFPPSATPAGITHYTLLRKVVCQMGALPPLETPTRKGGTLPLHGAHTAFSCYPALRLYRLSKSQHGIGVVSLIM